ncbi:hypothetical protein IGI04_019354 [Brassica rapa subsp. trilocularis]|uniref:Uncharacterized protein n=1 Tax=Brassica rapa subsp. trilocularis TaxID=1813537 RepID=A0ABQ7MHZ4_BRACM|nr:hypothetical protein IGI04_019354 [Brassica rapa subsp. trilocularis]
MPPVSCQSASCSRRYARFTEEWSVCLARGSCREEKATSIDAAFCTSIDGDPRSYIHISTRAMKRGFLGPSRKELAGLCTISKSKREVSIDTLQGASIDIIHHQSIDTIHPTLIDKRQAAVIDRANKSSNNTVHRGTIHRGTIHPGTVHPGIVHYNTIHPSTVHHDTIHRDTIHLPSIDTIQIPSIETIHVPSIDTVHPVSVDTIHIPSVYTFHIPSIDTVHPVSVDTIHIPSIEIVHPVSVDTIRLPSIDTIHLLSIDTVYILSLDFVHPNTVHPNTIHRDTVHPNTVLRDTVHRNTIHRGTVPPMTNTTYGETEKVEALILKIDKKDHEKGIITSLCQISISQIMDFAYNEQDEDFEIPTTHVKQPDIQVHHADESKQKDELNREKLVNYDTVKDDEYHVSGEQSKVEEADTKDPTSALIDSSNSKSIDIRTSETIDTNICHRSIPSTIPDATTVYVRTGRPKAIRDYNKVADISDTSSSSIDTLTITSIVTPTSSSIDPSTSEMIDTDFCHRSIPLEILERSSCPQDIANSTQESIDESSCDLTSDVDKVTLKDFLELEEWLRQKLDDQPASGKGLKNSLKADDIDRHKPDEIDRHPPYDIDVQSPSNIDQHTPDCIARYPPDCIDRHPCLDELSGYMIEPELVGRKEHTSGASHLAVPENLRPPLCEEEALGFAKE